MSRKNYNEPYEDELDRMRARRKKSVSPRQRQRFEEDWDDDFDEVDFNENDEWEEDDYFDDDDWEEEPDVRPRNLRRTAYEVSAAIRWKNMNRSGRQTLRQRRRIFYWMKRAARPMCWTGNPPWWAV